MQAGLRAGVATTFVVAIFGFVLLLFERSHSHSDMAGMLGAIFMMMSPVIGIIGGIIGAISSTENVNYTMEDHRDDE